MTISTLSALVVAAPLLQARTQPVDVPFLVTDHAIIVDAIVNGKKVSAMFDTGFSGTFVLNESVNVGKPTGTMTLRDFVGELSAETIDIQTLEMGGVKIPATDKVVVRTGNSDWSSSYGTHCDGIMGLEVLKDFPFQINFEKSKFVILPDGYDITKEPTDGTRKQLIRMLPKGNNSIELTVRTSNGGKMYLALDTGNAFYATTHKDVLERIGLWKNGEKPKFAKQSWVASGPVDSWSLLVKDLNIYGVPVPEAVLDIIDLPSSSADHDGTVGFGFLKNFNITIDMKKRYVLLENFSGQVAELPKGSVGLGAVHDPRTKRMRIYSVAPESPAAKAGIQRGDDLLGINGELITNVTPQRIDDLLEGEVGTTVNVSTSRGGVLRRFDLERALLVNTTP